MGLFSRAKPDADAQPESADDDLDGIDVGGGDEERVATRHDLHVAAPDSAVLPGVSPVATADAGRADDLAAKLLRLQADFDNFRRRNAAARAEAGDDARRQLFAALLPVHDNLLLAMRHGASTPEVADYAAGIDAIRSQFADALAAQGLAEIPARAGDSFDANVHEAMGTALAEPAGPPPGAIHSLVRPGFTHRGRVVRPAAVLIVGDHP